MSHSYITRSLTMNQDRKGGIIGLKGSLIGRRFDVRNNVDILFGRDSSQVDVVVRGEKVSRVHLSIRFNYYRNDYTVIDCSTNGTYIGENRYYLHKDKRRVPSGTILMLGDEENILQLL